MNSLRRANVHTTPGNFPWRWEKQRVRAHERERVGGGRWAADDKEEDVNERP